VRSGPSPKHHRVLVALGQAQARVSETRSQQRRRRGAPCSRLGRYRPREHRQAAVRSPVLRRNRRREQGWTPRRRQGLYCRAARLSVQKKSSLRGRHFRLRPKLRGMSPRRRACLLGEEVGVPPTLVRAGTHLRWRPQARTWCAQSLRHLTVPRGGLCRGVPGLSRQPLRLALSAEVPRQTRRAHRPFGQV